MRKESLMKHFGVTFGEKGVLKTMSMDTDLTPSQHRQSLEAYRLMELGKTSIKVERLRHCLKTYPNKFDAHRLLDGFTNGFKKALPMGCSAACALFEKFACFLEWLVRFQSCKESIQHYLDDFLLAGEARSGECLHLMNNFRIICSDIGVPLAEEKTLGPSCIMTFLGLEIDTFEMVIRIPQDKLTEVKEKLELTIKKRKITLKDLQSLVGSLNFCAKAIPSVRAFNRRFCDAMCGIQRPNHFIRVTLGMKEDIKTWLTFLENFNGTLAFGESEWLSNCEIHLFTDSAGNPDLVAQIPHGSTTSRDRGDTNSKNFSAADFRSEIDRLVDASLASNTKDTYRTGLRKDFDIEFYGHILFPCSQCCMMIRHGSPSVEIPR
ncbi:unnamed protein product [Mytilus coruscus]|uniref:Reverse transcriptase domain-containing protein n=1 Tax=Mytilus coruscus TaxID=42192 RepID=A0A6J8BWT8_MYTCO|nr:unnamed protein product [Mytilus coruscus]